MSELEEKTQAQKESEADQAMTALTQLFSTPEVKPSRVKYSSVREC
jgi:hypothetical protein